LATFFHLMTEQKFKVLIKNGEIRFNKKDKFRREKLLSLIETEYEGKCIVTIDRFRPKATDLQRKRYWATLKEVTNITGYDQKELHEICKAKFLTDVIEVDGKLVTQQGSTTKLDTTEMTIYMEKVVIFLTDFFEIQNLNTDE